MKKNVCALLLAASVLTTMPGCGSSSASDSTKSPNTTVVEAPARETEAPPAPLMDSGDFHGLTVSIGELEHIKDYAGDPAVLIHFTFTNNSEENKSAMFSLSWTAFQNGIGLKEAFVTEESIHNSADLSKEIQPGATIELTDVYTLSSDTAPVEFFISEAISFDDTKLGKTFEISPDGETILSVAPGLESATEIDNYAVSVNSYNIAKDYDGNPVLILNMGYTNNGNTDSPFYVAIDVKAFQDGIELEKAFISDKTVMDNDSNYLHVRPGAGHGVAEAFVLTSETSPVDIEIAGMFSLSDEKITTQINLSE